MRSPILLLSALLLAAPGCAVPEVAPPGLTLTPSQTEGPFYPRPIPDETDQDLTRMDGAPGAAAGDVIMLSGHVRRADGSALGGAVVEIWQADAQGIYQHPNDPRRARRDPNFQGYGRVVTDAQGRYVFRTVRPAPYAWRTAHIHVRVHPADGSAAFTTQAYFPDEARNSRDIVLGFVRDSARRQALMVRLQPDPAGTMHAEFDIVLR